VRTALLELLGLTDLANNSGLATTQT